MRGLLALAALLVGLQGALSVSRFHERNHTGLLFLYAFDEGQVPTSPPSEVRDASGRYLMGNLTASTTGAVAWSVERQGFDVPNVGGGARAISQSSSEALISRLTNEFSIELFLSTPLIERSGSRLIAGFGHWAPGEPLKACNATHMTSGGWRLTAGLGDAIDFQAVLLSHGELRCVYGTIVISTDDLRHLVIRVRDGLLSIVSHGSFTTVSGPEPMLSPSAWARNPAPLQIATPQAVDGWTGSLYMIAMYDRFLSNEEIAANRGFGPPNSVPWGPSAALALDEDTAIPLRS